jgi:hypothetical protein
MAVWLFQVSFVIIIIADALDQEKLKFTPPENTRLAFARFAAGMLM